MIRNRMHLFVLSVTIFLGMVGCANWGLEGGDRLAAGTPEPLYTIKAVTGPPEAAIANPFETGEVPFIAVWLERAGIDMEYPFLRVAIWEDGRVVFAEDPNTWSHHLLLGQISPSEVESLKQLLPETGLFDLKERRLLYPDSKSVLLSFAKGGTRQELAYAEFPEPVSGPLTDDQIQLVKTWFMVNRIVLAALPSHAQALHRRFPEPPESWRGE
ncbi:MAG: hypothetical protein WC655_16525 [Candidatus Hydrogenedentales bacterium]|jgi:hypothetical protein